MFSEESKFVLDFHDGRQRVWRRIEKRSQPPAMMAQDRYRGASVMVCRGITMTGAAELHICQGNVTGLYYRDNVIEPIAVPYVCRHGNASIFRDDSARAHRALVGQDHL